MSLRMLYVRYFENYCVCFIVLALCLPSKEKKKTYSTKKEEVNCMEDHPSLNLFFSYSDINDSDPSYFQ